MKVVLVMFTPEGERRDVPVKHKRVTLGRDSSCDIRVPIGAVSRTHCRIEVTDDGVTVTDLDSRNGTYRNEDQITETEPLNAGDRLAVGPIVFTVQIDGVPEPVEPPLLESPMVAHKEAAPKQEEEVRDAIVDSEDSDAGISDLLADLDGSSEFDFDLDDLEDSHGA